MATVKLNDLTKEEKKPAEQPRKAISKVINGNVVVRKPSLLSKFKSTFFADDIQNVKSYAIKDVIIPGIKHLFLDSLSMLILGERCYTGSAVKKSSGATYSYNTVYKSKLDRETKYKRSSDTREKVNYKELLYESRGEAEVIRDTLVELIEGYDDASLADLYRAADCDFSSADYNFGWSSEDLPFIARAEAHYITSERMWVLDLPRPHPID